MPRKGGAYVGPAVVVAWVGVCVLSVLDVCSVDGVVSLHRPDTPQHALWRRQDTQELSRHSRKRACVKSLHAILRRLQHHALRPRRVLPRLAAQ